MARPKMRTITHRRGILHVETPLGIINVHVGLHDRHGREVERVEMLPCGEPRFAGEPWIIVTGSRFVKLKTPYHKRRHRTSAIGTRPASATCAACNEPVPQGDTFCHACDQRNLRHVEAKEV